VPVHPGTALPAGCLCTQQGSTVQPAGAGRCAASQRGAAGTPWQAVWHVPLARAQGGVLAFGGQGEADQDVHYNYYYYDDDSEEEAVKNVSARGVAIHPHPPTGPPPLLRRMLSQALPDSTPPPSRPGLSPESLLHPFSSAFNHCCCLPAAPPPPPPTQTTRASPSASSTELLRATAGGHTWLPSTAW